MSWDVRRRMRRPYALQCMVPLVQRYALWQGAVAACVADEIYGGAANDHYAPYAERIEMRAKAGWVVDTITQLINDLVTAHGSAGFADSALIQRVWRDQGTAARHGHTLSASGYEAHGKAMFGREDDARFVLPVV